MSQWVPWQLWSSRALGFSEGKGEKERDFLLPLVFMNSLSLPLGKLRYSRTSCMRPPKIQDLQDADKIRTTGVSSEQTEQIYFWKGICCSNFRSSCDLFTKRSSNNPSTMRQREIRCRGRLGGVPTTRLLLGKCWSYGRVVAHGHLIVLGFTLGQTAVAEVTGAMLASQLGLFDRASVSSPNSGADLGHIPTDFLNDILWTGLFTGYLNEHRRRNIRGGFRGMLSQKVSWLSESFRQDIGQFHSPLIKPCKSADYFISRFQLGMFFNIKR